MANELQYYADPTTDSGLTITAKVYDSTGTIVGSTISCIEVGTLAIYMGDMPSTIAGNYVVRFFQEDIMIGQGIIEWDGSQEVTYAKEQTLLQTETDIINQINANETKIDTIDTVVDSIKTKVDTLNNTDLTNIEADLEIINQGVKKASILIPHNTNL